MKTFVVFIDEDNGASEDWNIFYMDVTAIIKAKDDITAQKYANEVLLPIAVDAKLAEDYELDDEFPTWELLKADLIKTGEIEDSSDSKFKALLMEVEDKDIITV